MKVKICGITNLPDAQAAIEAGADLLGFNFYSKSPRYVTPETAQSIVRQIRAHDHCPTLVGVFVNSPVEEIRSILHVVNLNLAQLHGDEPPEFLEHLNEHALKALRPTSVEEAAADAAKYAPLGAKEPMLLIDAYRKDQYGGTGHMGDWSLAAKMAQRYPILLAGGLTPENVTEAIRQVMPWGVDVASGVEFSPGKKDAARMREFVANAQGAGTCATDKHESTNGNV